MSEIESVASSDDSSNFQLGDTSAKLLSQLRRQHASDSTSKPGKQLWKINDGRAQKEGIRRGVYWVQEKQEDYITRTFRTGKEPYKKKWKTGSMYTGEWKGDQKHGFGIQVWPNGNKYEGDWFDGVRHGHGTFWVKNKRAQKLRKVYAGNWRSDLKEGLGAFFYKNRDLYEGEWKRGLRDGKGKLFYANGDLYAGDWVEDKRCGHGMLRLETGDCYQGEWLNDKKEGPGEYFYKSRKKVYVGEWVNDVPKCGIYSDADFAEDVDPDTGARVPVDPPPPFSYNTQRPLEIPELSLCDPDAVLRGEIQRIRDDRDVVRSVPHLDLTEMFDSVELHSLQQAFSSIDKDGNGYIHPRELRQSFDELDYVVSEEELGPLLVDLDKDADGVITFPEFVRAIYILEQNESRRRFDGDETGEREREPDDESGEDPHRDREAEAAAYEAALDAADAATQS